MKLTIIYPTRSRYELFVKSTETLIQNASTTSNIEILVAMDNDDLDAVIKTAEYIKNKPYIRLYVSDRHGYKFLNRYVNDLAHRSSGDYLLLWNDDCTMLTKNYDLVMDKYKGKFIVVNPLVVNHADYCRRENRMLFPIIPREWVNITGRWSNSGACDSWVEVISNWLGISQYEDDIKIHHDRFDLTHQNADKTYHEGMLDKPYVSDNFWGSQQDIERRRDAKLVGEYLAQLPR